MEFSKITVEGRYPDWESICDYISEPEEILLNDEYFTTVRRLSLIDMEIVVPNNFASSSIQYDKYDKAYTEYPCDFNRCINIYYILDLIDDYKDFELIIINLDPRVIDIDVDNIPIDFIVGVCNHIYIKYDGHKITEYKISYNHMNADGSISELIIVKE